MLPTLLALGTAAATPDPTWSVDLGAGFTIPWKTKQSQLLGQEGYSRTRWSAFAGGTCYPFPAAIGIGGWAAYGASSSSALHGGPVLNERIAMAGIAVPVPVLTDSVAFFVVPRLARTWHTLSLHGDAHTNATFAYGGDLELFSRKAHIGAILRFLRAPISGGGVARDDDAGGVFIGLGGLIDG